MDVAVVVLSLGSGSAAVLQPWPPRADLAGLAALAIAGSSVALFARRRVPAVPFLIAVLANVVYFAAVHASRQSVSDVSILFASYALAGYGRHPRRWVLAAAGSLLIAVAQPLAGAWSGLPWSPYDLVGGVVGVWGPWLLGMNVRGRRLHIAAVEERAARIEAERTLASVRAVIEERNRIARELHDVVAHHISVMGVQAGAARLALERDPARTRLTLGAIEATSRQAVEEMRRMLGVLRGPALRPDDQPGRPDLQPALPQPGLRDLATLAEHFRTAGLPLTLSVDWRVRDVAVPPEVLQLSAFRIVEQSLTNVLEHAGAVPTVVRVRVEPGAVDVMVQNDPPRQPVSVRSSGRTGRGQGTVGMRERVALFDGTLRHEVLPGGGYRVHARLHATATEPSTPGLS